MEIDVASICTTEQTKLETKPPQPSRHELRPLAAPSSDRKRRKSESSSTALKSILRQRSDPASNFSVLGQKLKRKRAVKFTLAEKAEEHQPWSDKRLRYLALDLDRWDNLPHCALRTINKQKTRHTKRLKCCHSTEDLDHGKVTRPEMDDGAFLKIPQADKIDLLTRRSAIPETVPEMESIEKSFFVNRWLQQNSQLPHTSGQPHLQGSVSAPLTFLSSSSSFSRPYHSASTFSPCAFGIPNPSVSLGVLPGPSQIPPVSLQPAAAVAQVAPDTTNSLQSLATNFHTLSLRSSSWARPE